MKKHLITFSFAALLLTACGAAEKEIEVHNAWVRPTAQGGNAAVYLILVNNTTLNDKLTSVSSPAAEVVETHETKIENDVMQMSMIPSVPVAAGTEIAFEPGGLHIMLFNLRQELIPGEHIEITLHFENHEDILVEVPIKNAAPDGGMDH